MVGIGEHEEYILQDGKIELAEKDARGLGVSFRHIVHKLKAHRETGILYFTIVVLASPHAGVDNEFELTSIQLEQRWETV